MPGRPRWLAAANATKMSVLVGTLQGIVGPDRVILDAAERDFYSSDLFFAGPAAAIVIQPGTRDELAAAVAAITGSGVAVVARGGGLSYTKGYVPQKPGVRRCRYPARRAHRRNQPRRYVRYC